MAKRWAARGRMVPHLRRTAPLMPVVLVMAGTLLSVGPGAPSTRLPDAQAGYVSPLVTAPPTSPGTATPSPASARAGQPAAGPTGSPVPGQPSGLTEPPSHRNLGLPAALALVALIGVGWAHVRLLRGPVPPVEKVAHRVGGPS